jgi:hypothetical protein
MWVVHSGSCDNIASLISIRSEDAINPVTVAADARIDPILKLTSAALAVRDDADQDWSVFGFPNEDHCRPTASTPPSRWPAHIMPSRMPPL